MMISSLVNLLSGLDSGFVVRQCTLHSILYVLDYLRKNYWNWCVPSAGPGWHTHCSIGSPTLPPLSDTDMHRKLPLSHCIFICKQVYYCRNVTNCKRWQFSVSFFSVTTTYMVWPTIHFMSFTDYFDLNNSLSSDAPAHLCDARVTSTLAGRFLIDVVSTTAKY